ncbi:MAG TPA: universal stress protein [Gemmatimonadaceae bacterium]|nr:universal stress protein [Gemmatimonadaceae bacterium]
MYRHILVPIDGSPLSERALRYAVPLAERHGARLTLLHVAAPMLDAIAGGGAPVREPALDAAWRAEDRKAVERIAKRTRKQTAVQVDVVYREGRPAPAIAEFATTEGVSLVVLCTHGRGGFERLWLGSVADALLRQLTVPTLLVRGARGADLPEPGEELFPHILVPLDGSPRAERALAEAIGLVGNASVSLTLLSVVHPTAAMGAKSFPSQAERELCASYLEPLAARHRTERRSIAVETTVTANVGRAIVEHAKRHDASLIALATQGLGGVQRFIVGSVADKLLRTSPVPVLVLP